MQYFSINSFDGRTPQSINPSHIAYDTSIASQSQSMSISQPNLEVYRICNQIEGPQFAYYSPVNYSTRCSSASTLPPSISRCGSPIQPILLSPLNLSQSTTPFGSHQNISDLPVILPVSQKDYPCTFMPQNPHEIPITVQKNNSCNSIYSAPEDVFRVEQHADASGQSKCCDLERDGAEETLNYDTFTSKQTFIFISHLHSDHYLELGPLLHTAWTAGLKTKVTVYGQNFIGAPYL